MDYREKYETLNNSFDKVMVYHVGIDAGFFAEYTYMIDAMIYCLVNKIQFRLYADDANFGYDKGWEDYFQSFCPMVHDDVHHTCNYHPIPSISELWTRSMSEVKNGGLMTFCKMIAWKVKRGVKTRIGKQKATRINGEPLLFNSDINWLSPEEVEIPELDIKRGDYMEAFRRMVDITWRFNEEMEKYLAQAERDLQIPDEFHGCQLRGGDKITEVASLLSANYVIDELRRGVTVSDIFVLTDDYQLYQEVCKSNPRINFHTLCSEEEKGYVNSAFSEKRGEGKKQQMYRFLATMEIMKRARRFAGSITTGPSLFLLKYLRQGAVPVDWYDDRIPELACKRIYVRSKMSEEYLKGKN